MTEAIMPRPRSGLCVGGPLDGQSLSYADDRYKVPVLDNPIQPPYGDGSSVIDRTESFESIKFYHWHEVLRGDVTLCVWAFDTMTKAEALAQIIRHYHLGEARVKFRKRRMLAALRDRIGSRLQQVWRKRPHEAATDLAEAVLDLFDYGEKE